MSAAMAQPGSTPGAGRLASKPLTPASRLAPYLPRLALEWLATCPDQRHRRLPGTLLFVDVSGFTSLTERLAARGKIGAEEITDVIGAVFNELLGVASTYGADLLKWGGDAVLLYFAEPDSVARGCRAGGLITRSMKRIGNFKTSAGRIKLGVSVGVHSGEFDFYLLGDLHRELIITGPDASITAQMESVAESGEVLVSPATAARLDPAAVGQTKGEGVLLDHPPDADPRPLGRQASLTDEDVLSLVPVHYRQLYLGGAIEAEHRQATTAFIEFSGVDTLNSQGGPAQVGEWLDPVVSAIQHAAERHGAGFHETDISADGGKVVLLGGIPVLGNDSERVLRAVREVVAGHPINSPIRLRAGVNVGRVFAFAHNFEQADRQVFAITGDAVNLAARVMGKAQPGQVLATEAVLIRAEHPFEVERLPPFKVKGKSEPVIASAIGPPRYANQESPVEDLPFIGREAELTRILELASEVARGTGRVLEISGPSGIGKSRLVSEALERWPLSTVRIGCEEYGSVAPYRPMRRLVRQVLGLTDDIDPQLGSEVFIAAVRAHAPEFEPYASLVGEVIDVPVPATRQVMELEPRFRRTWLERGMVALLRGYLASPSALVFEDAHALDEASATLLARLKQEVADLPVLVVTTTLTDDATEQPPGGELIVLEPLSGDAAARLARSEDGFDLPPVQVAAIVERADGNPLFLRELLRTARQNGGTAELPDSLEPLLVAEIDRLAQVDRQFLRAASVLGTHVDPSLIPALLDDPEGADQSVWSRLAVFLRPTADGWRFVHALMREAAYEGLSFKRRKDLHARAAMALERRMTFPEESSDLLSLHWMHAERYDRVWAHARIAGDRARHLWANAEAAIFYARALDASSHLSLPRDEMLSVAEALGDVAELAADYRRARHAYGQAAQLTSSAANRARIMRKIGVLHERNGRYPQALRCYTRGRNLLSGIRQKDSVIDLRDMFMGERCELDLASSGIRLRQGRYREGMALARQAAHEAESARHDAGVAHSLYLQHLISVYLAEPDDSLGLAALETFESIGDLVGQGNALNNLGISAYYRGRWAESTDFYDRSREARLRSGDAVGAATEENNIGEILSDQGHFEAAGAFFESAAATWRGAGYKVGVALATSNLGRLAARQGDIEAGRARLLEAESQFHRMGSAVFLVENRLRLCECQVLGGDFESARSALNDLTDETRGRSGFEHAEAAALRLTGTAEALATEPRRGIAWLDSAVERAVAIDNRYEAALALATRAEIGGERDGEDGRQADEIFDRLGVQQAVITWAGPDGGPLMARAPIAAVNGSG